MEIGAIKLRNSYQVCYVDINNIFLPQHALCIIESENGVDMGNVLKSHNYSKCHAHEVTGKIIRLATDADKAVIAELETIEEKAFAVCREKSREKNLDMKLINVKALFDKSKLIFYFVSENRVDFRDLVRELASVFRMRIEMRQIGVRDAARVVGGYGPCGVQQCCTSMRVDFEPVSIKMAKEQNLNLNSQKISGMCGRLLCCLGYEYHTYLELNRGMPRLGAEIVTEKAKYTVIGADTLKQTVTIRSHDRYIQISRDDIERSGNRYLLKEATIEKIVSEATMSSDSEFDTEF